MGVLCNGGSGCFALLAWSLQFLRVYVSTNANAGGHYGQDLVSCLPPTHCPPFQAERVNLSWHLGMYYCCGNRLLSLPY